MSLSPTCCRLFTRLSSIGSGDIGDCLYATRTLPPLVTLLVSLALDVVDPRGALFAPREITFPFRDDVLLHAGETDAGKLWRSPKLAYDGRAVPLVVMVHGITGDFRRYHWLSPDPMGPYDARPFVAEMVEQGEVAPLVVAMASQTMNADSPEAMFVDFDFDPLIDAIDAALQPFQRVDRDRIIVIGHSAAACYSDNASFASLKAKRFHPYALLALEGCMSDGMGELLAATHGARHVIVGYVPEAWERPFGEFFEGWSRGLPSAPIGTIRTVERYPMTGMTAHLDIVESAMRAWLPRLLPPSEHDRVTANVTLDRDL